MTKISERVVRAFLREHSKRFRKPRFFLCLRVYGNSKPVEVRLTVKQAVVLFCAGCVAEENLDTFTFFEEFLSKKGVKTHGKKRRKA